MTDHPDSLARRVFLGAVAWIGLPIATLVLLEGAASAYLFARDLVSTRKAPSALYRPYTARDTLLGWVTSPNVSSPNEYGKGVSFTTDTHGFRKSGTAAVESPAARVRLVCSGDSYTSGTGVSDANHWCGLLESRFDGLRTMNMGQGAYGLDQAYLWYARDGIGIPHQIHVVALTDAQFERSISDQIGGRFKPYLAIEGGRLVTRNIPVPPQSAAALKRAATSRLVGDLRVVQLLRRFAPFDKNRATTRDVDADWPLFEKVIETLASQHRTRGSQLVVAYLPMMRDVKPGHADERRRRLAIFTRQHAIRFVDLTPALRALRPDSLDLAFISRPAPGAPAGMIGQYSNLGHAWVARVLADSLATIPALAPLRIGGK